MAILLSRLDLSDCRLLDCPDRFLRLAFGFGFGLVKLKLQIRDETFLVVTRQH